MRIAKDVKKPLEKLKEMLAACSARHEMGETDLAGKVTAFKSQAEILENFLTAANQAFMKVKLFKTDQESKSFLQAHVHEEASCTGCCQQHTCDI